MLCNKILLSVPLDKDDACKLLFQTCEQETMAEVCAVLTRQQAKAQEVADQVSIRKDEEGGVVSGLEEGNSVVQEDEH